MEKLFYEKKMMKKKCSFLPKKEWLNREPAKVQVLALENGHLEEKPAKVQGFFSYSIKSDVLEKNTCIFAGICKIQTENAKKKCKNAGFLQFTIYNYRMNKASYAIQDCTIYGKILLKVVWFM